MRIQYDAHRGQWIRLFLQHISKRQLPNLGEHIRWFRRCQLHILLHVRRHTTGRHGIHSQYRSCRPLGNLLCGHSFRQWSHHRGCGPGTLLALSDQLLHHIARCGGFSCRPGRHAISSHLWVHGQKVDFWGVLVWPVALIGRPRVHILDTQPMCNLAGSLLGHHGPIHVPIQNDHVSSLCSHRSRLDLLQSHLIPSDFVVAGNSVHAHPWSQMPLHPRYRLPCVLLHYLLLWTIVRHGVYLLSNLPGRRPANQVTQVGHETLHRWRHRTHSSNSSRRSEGGESAATVGECFRSV